MKRPLLLRLLPNRLRQTLYYRYYHSRSKDWRELFASAPLAFAPGRAMYQLMPGDIISGNIAFNGFYELMLSVEMMRGGGEGGRFVDVGANMGYFSLLWANANPKGKVTAFEAAPSNVALLRGNIQRNGLEDRIEVQAKAAGRERGTALFDGGPAEQTGWGGITLSPSRNTFEVPVVRLDEELPDLPIDVLKIDVEGADTWVLYGCERSLKEKRIRKIFFEQNPTRMESLEIESNAAQEFLHELGYHCEPFGPANDQWQAYPAR